MIYHIRKQVRCIADQCSVDIDFLVQEEKESNAKQENCKHAVEKTPVLKKKTNDLDLASNL